MSIFEAIILGIVQGLTEFLPISSSGHLRIVPALFGWEDPGAAFTAVIQIGTMISILIFFWRDIVRIFRAWFRGLTDPVARMHHDSKMGWFVIIGTIPISVFGLLLQDQIETTARSLYLIGTMLIAVGLLMGVVDRYARHDRDLEATQLRDGILVGLAQALALIPGVSRSGITLTMGLGLGMNREAAARFSFLLSIPAIFLSGVYQLVDVLRNPSDLEFVPTLIASAVSLVVGYASIAFLLKFLQQHSTNVFVVYRVLLGVLILALVATGSIS